MGLDNMKALLVKINNSKSIKVNGEGLDSFGIHLFGTNKSEAEFQMQVSGATYSLEKYTQHSWANEEIDIGDKVIIECVSSVEQDKPIEVIEHKPESTCIFCHKTKEQVICLIADRHNINHICNECVDVCVKVVADYKKDDEPLSPTLLPAE